MPPVYPILDVGSLRGIGCDVTEAAAALLNGGAEILQFRHKEFWDSAAVDTAAAVAELCLAAGAIFLVNDRADYAALLQAGLHVGQDDLSPGDARKVLGDGPIVGFSTHNLAQLAEAEAEDVDYSAFGPVFSTASKWNPDPTVGLELLRAARDVTSKPLVAIGGVTLDSAAAVWSAGADSVAIIGALLPAGDEAQSIPAAMERRMAQWIRRSRNVSQNYNIPS